GRCVTRAQAVEGAAPWHEGIVAPVVHEKRPSTDRPQPPHVAGIEGLHVRLDVENLRLLRLQLQTDLQTRQNGAVNGRNERETLDAELIDGACRTLRDQVGA